MDFCAEQRAGNVAGLGVVSHWPTEGLGPDTDSTTNGLPTFRTTSGQLT
jgi:hypothetical protein